MPKPFVLSVKALVRDDQRRYLILRRSAGSKNNPGKWDLPGGKVDTAEAFDSALIREIKEETGLCVELERVLGATEWELKDRNVVYLMLQTHVTAGQIRLSEEHDSHKWESMEQLVLTDICPQFQSFVRSLAPSTI